MASTRGDKRRIEKRSPFISKQFPLPALCTVFNSVQRKQARCLTLHPHCTRMPTTLVTAPEISLEPLAASPQLELGPETTRWEMREEDSLFGAMTSKVKCTYIFEDQGCGCW